MKLDKPAKWKTLDKLIDLSIAIRQVKVNNLGDLTDILVPKNGNITLNSYKEFMSLARANDL